MQIHIEFGTQVRAASGTAHMQVQSNTGHSLAQLLIELTSSHPALATWINQRGQPQAGLLVFVNDQAPTDFDIPLRDGDHVALMTLVSGG